MKNLAARFALFGETKSRFKFLLLITAAAFAGSLLEVRSSHAGTIWDGGGGTGGRDIGFNLNWDADTTPNLTGGTSVLTFGTGGDIANVNATAVNVLGIVFNRDAPFSIAAGTGAGTLTIGASGISAAAPTATARTYTISEQTLTLSASQIWSVDNTVGATTLTVSSAIGDGVNNYSITKSGTGTLSLTGTGNSYSGATIINGGTLTAAADGAIPTASAVTVNSGGTLRVTSVRGIDTNGTLTVNDGGTVFINNNATNVRLDLSTLDMTGGQITGTFVNNVFWGMIVPTINVHANTTASIIDTVRLSPGAAPLSFTVDSNAQANVSAFIANDPNGPTSALNKLGAGTLTLSGSNTYTGNTTVSGGLLEVNAPGTLYSAASTANNTAVVSVKGDGTLRLAGWNFAFSSTDGSLGTLARNAGQIVLGDATTGGTIEYDGPGNADAIQANRPLTILAGGGTLKASGSGTWYVGSSTDDAGNTWVSSASGPLTLTGSGDGAMYGKLPGGGGVTKSGAGTWTIGSNNTYTGDTTVSGGTLALAHATLNNNIAGSPTITLGSNTVLDVTGLAGTADLILASGQTLQGTGTIQGNLTVGNNTTIAPGASPGTMFQVGNQTWMNGGTFAFDIDDADGTAGLDPGWSLLDISGAGSGVLDLTSLTSFTIDIDSLLHSTHVPGALDVEPGTTYVWDFVHASGGILNFDPGVFTFNTTDFTSIVDGSFSIRQTGNELELVFQTVQAVPEPASITLWVMLAALVVGAGFRFSAKQSKSK